MGAVFLFCLCSIYFMLFLVNLNLNIQLTSKFFHSYFF